MTRKDRKKAKLADRAFAEWMADAPAMSDEWQNRQGALIAAEMDRIVLASIAEEMDRIHAL